MPTCESYEIYLGTFDYIDGKTYNATKSFSSSFPTSYVMMGGCVSEFGYGSTPGEAVFKTREIVAVSSSQLYVRWYCNYHYPPLSTYVDYIAISGPYHGSI